MPIKTIYSPIVAVLLLGSMTSSLADSEHSTVSHDGLHLVKSTDLKTVYMKPGSNLDEYNKVALLTCYVAFNKDWQRNYNEGAINLSDRVTDEDMQKIKSRLGSAFDSIFSDVLSSGGHQIVDQGGTGVLIVRPAITNLEVAAPDTMPPYVEADFTATAAQMTLYMELYDGRTGDIIARIIDPEVAGNDFFQLRNNVSNSADENRVIRRWAVALNNHLESVADRN